MLNPKEKRKIRHLKIKKRIRGDSKKPRLVVFKSSNHIYAQLVDDQNNKILAFASSLKVDRKKIAKTKNNLKGKIAIAFEVGRILAKKAIDKKVNRVVFDRGGWPYHGRIKALSEGARDGGLNF